MKNKGEGGKFVQLSKFTWEIVQTRMVEAF